MKILITGGTGFLGRFVVKGLAELKTTERVYVISRRGGTTSTNTKIKHIRADLSNTLHLPTEVEEIDAVIHLAASYDFSAPAATDYVHNVLATQNLVNWLKENAKQGVHVPIIAASSYSVGIGQSTSTWCETPLANLPSRRFSYPRTKALAERVLIESPFPVRLLRLGILVGDSLTGAVEKPDGPYAVLKFLARMANYRIGRRCPIFPIPGKPDGVLPLVPVDSAAKAVLECLRKTRQLGAMEVFGVYNSQSVNIDHFIRRAFHELAIDGRPIYAKWIPEVMLSWQKHITGIAGENFAFALQPPPLDNPRFVRNFESCIIPSFDDFSDVFFAGFKDYVGTLS